MRADLILRRRLSLSSILNLSSMPPLCGCSPHLVLRWRVDGGHPQAVSFLNLSISPPLCECSPHLVLWRRVDGGHPQAVLQRGVEPLVVLPHILVAVYRLPDGALQAMEGHMSSLGAWDS